METEEKAVEQPAQPSALLQRIAAPEQLQPNPWAPEGVVHEFMSWPTLVPADAALARADFDRAIDALKPRPSELQIANLRMKLARSGKGAEAVTLLECDYPASDGEQKGMYPGHTNVRHGAVPVVAGVKLLLDEKRSPEAEIARRKVMFREQHTAREQEAARSRAIEEEKRNQEIKLLVRARHWISRPHVERTLLRLAHARPQDADLLRALAAALITDADSEGQIPPGDIDLLPKVRPF